MKSVNRCLIRSARRMPLFLRVAADLDHCIFGGDIADVPDRVQRPEGHIDDRSWSRPFRFPVVVELQRSLLNNDQLRMLNAMGRIGGRANWLYRFMDADSFAGCERAGEHAAGFGAIRRGLHRHLFPQENPRRSQWVISSGLSNCDAQSESSDKSDPGFLHSITPVHQRLRLRDRRPKEAASRSRG